jgi:hypothetical protein
MVRQWPEVRAALLSKSSGLAPAESAAIVMAMYHSGWNVALFG